MPKIFSSEDLQAIRARLLVVGREQFLRYGLKRTRIEDLASAVGISKGTFYHFFTSKESLCLEIYEAEEVGVGQEVRSILSRNRDPVNALTEVLRYALAFIKGDSLLRYLRESGEFALLTRGIDRTRLSDHQDHDLELVNMVIASLEEKGARVLVSPDILAGILRAITMLPFHMTEIGEQVFDTAMEVFIAGIVHQVVGESPDCHTGTTGTTGTTDIRDIRDIRDFRDTEGPKEGGCS